MANLRVTILVTGQNSHKTGGVILARMAGMLVHKCKMVTCLGEEIKRKIIRLTGAQSAVSTATKVDMSGESARYYWEPRKFKHGLRQCQQDLIHTMDRLVA